MTNFVKYNQYPDKSLFTELYKTKTQNELASYYKCNKNRIRKWIIHFGLNLRPQGGGNNRKYNIDKVELEKLVKDGYSNKEICNILNIRSNSSLNKWLKKYNIIREYETDQYNDYKNKARRLTEKTYAIHKDKINPNNYPRTLCGVDGGYQLDHIISVVDCYKNGISIEECASLENLQMLSWIDNLGKRTNDNKKS